MTGFSLARNVVVTQSGTTEQKVCVASTAQIGRAAELLARGILLERGYSPLRSDVDDRGIDFSVCGRSVQVKSARLSGLGQYVFRWKRGWLAQFNVLRGVEHDMWWILPRSEIEGHQTVSISPNVSGFVLGRPREQDFSRFLNAWELLYAPRR